MPYSFTQQDHEFPVELQRQIHQALQPVAEMQMRRMKTSVPGTLKVAGLGSTIHK